MRGCCSLVYRYGVELWKRGFLVFAIKGVGYGFSRREALLEAKKPVTIPRGFVYRLDYRSRQVTIASLNFLRKGGGLAVPGINNGLMWIDIEGRLAGEMGDMVLDRFNGCFIERTPRGGLHVALKVDDLSLVKWRGVKGFLDNKTYGYCITYPSRLYLKYSGVEEELVYEKLSKVDLWDTGKASKYRRALKWLLGEVEGYVADVSPAEGSVKYNCVPEPVQKLVSGLSLNRLLLLFQLVCDEVGCGRCVEYYLSQLYSSEPIELKNPAYPTSVPRGLHTVLEVELLGGLRLIGASPKQLEELCSRIKYTVDGKEYSMETPPARNLYYNTLRGTYSIALKGLCPLMVANSLHGRYVPRTLCTSTLVKKVSSLTQNNPLKILELLEAVLELETR